LQFNFALIIDRVTIGSVQHLVPIILSVFLSAFLIGYSKRHLSTKQKHLVFNLIASCISLTVIVFHVYYISLGNYSLRTDLPFFLCTLMALIIPVFSFYRKFWMYEILLFWIIAGTSQAVVTPDIPIGFPSFDYFRYWVVHLGLIIIIFYATIVLGMRPKLESAFKSLAALMIYIVIMMSINYSLESNYSYLNYKPQFRSILDYLSDWPWYLLQVGALLIPYFLLIYALFKRK